MSKRCTLDFESFAFNHFYSSDLVARLLNAFEQIDGARVLITGGSGFVGKCLLATAKFAQHYSNSSIEIVIPTRNINAEHVRLAESIGCPRVTWIEKDLIHDVIRPGKIDILIHAATPASAHLTNSHPLEMFNVNILAILKSLQLIDQKIPVLFTSSGAVYGQHSNFTNQIEEKYCEFYESNRQLNSYGMGKVSAEQILRFAGDLGVCLPIVARLFTFSGRFTPLELHFALGNFVRDVLCGDPITITGDGKTIRSYLDGGDMATWIWAAVSRKVPDFPLHIGSDEPISMLALAELVASVAEQELGKRPCISIANGFEPNHSVRRYIPATSMTRLHLGVNQWTPLSESIRMMLRFPEAGNQT